MAQGHWGRVGTVEVVSIRVPDATLAIASKFLGPDLRALHKTLFNWYLRF